MKVVGFYLFNRLIPLEWAIEKSATPGDVVMNNGNYYRVFSDGQKYRFCLVNEEWKEAIECFVPSGSGTDVKGQGW